MTFSFAPRWKEELVVHSELGSFILEMPMGVVSVYMPDETTWQTRAPEWARPFWSELHDQLAAWCKSSGYPLYVEASAQVW